MTSGPRRIGGFSVVSKGSALVRALANDTANDVRREYLLVALFVMVPYCALVLHFFSIVDDAYISFRYAHNLSEGLGLRYNLDSAPPVEGYSNLLWVLLCALFELLHLDTPVVACVASWLCGATLILFVYRDLRRQFDCSIGVSLCGVALLAFYPPFAHWSTGGLATMPFALLLYATASYLWWRSSLATASVLGALLVLVRVEGIGWACVLGVLTLVSRTSPRERLRTVAIFSAVALGVFAVQELVRLAYYELPLPNTFYAKTRSSLDSNILFWKRGYAYVVGLALAMPGSFLILPAAVWCHSRGALFALLMAAGVVMYAVLVGGDYLPMGRFVIPGWSFAVVGITAWLSTVSRAGGAARYVAIAIALFALVANVLPAFDHHVTPESWRAGLNARGNLRSERSQWEFNKRGDVRGVKVARAMDVCLDSRDSVFLFAIGRRGYYSRMKVLDPGGLVTRSTEVWSSRRIRKKAGHDSYANPCTFLSQRPGYLDPLAAPIDAYVQRVHGWTRGCPAVLEDDYQLLECTTEEHGAFLTYAHKDLAVPATQSCECQVRGQASESSRGHR